MNEKRYHNTVPVKDRITLAAYETQAKKQDDQILEIFKANPEKLFTPFDIWRLSGCKWPITSVRRAITNLENDNKLFKTALSREGDYGRLNRTWKLKTASDTPATPQIGLFD